MRVTRTEQRPDVRRLPARDLGLAANLIWPFLAILRASDDDLHGALERFDLDVRSVEDPRFVLPHDTVMHMLLWLSARRGEEDVGIRAARWTDLAPKSILDLAATTSGSFRQYVEVFNAHSHLVAESVDFEAQVEGDRLVYAFRPRTGIELPPEAIDFAMGTTVVRCLRASKPAPALRYVELKRPRPRNDENYRAFFRCPVRFGGAQNLAVFEGIEAPALRADPVLHATLCDQLRRLTAERATVRPLSERVRDAIAELLAEGHVRSTQVAKRLAMSGSHLRHLLRAEGTSFREEWDLARRERALRLLDESELTVENVAEDLGFRHVNGFIKAFRRWTGETPGEYRRAALVASTRSRPPAPSPRKECGAGETREA